jgi:hypothetical protein
MKRDAYFSDDRVYRYWLSREWGPVVNPLVVIGLNPSTADETQDDPTIRRCIRFATDWGHDALYMLNLFAYRSTDPRALRSIADPIGPDNDITLRVMCEHRRVLAAWGTHGTLGHRCYMAKPLLKGVAGIDLVTLGLTKEGHPKHPLYIAASTQPQEWR